LQCFWLQKSNIQKYEIQKKENFTKND
jgi:hypothetical protein